MQKYGIFYYETWNFARIRLSPKTKVKNLKLFQSDFLNGTYVATLLITLADLLAKFYHAMALESLFDWNYPISSQLYAHDLYRTTHCLIRKPWTEFRFRISTGFIAIMGQAHISARERNFVRFSCAAFGAYGEYWIWNRLEWYFSRNRLTDFKSLPWIFEAARRLAPLHLVAATLEFEERI